VEAHVTTRLTAFTDDELAYMRGERRLARLATAGVDGTPHVVPVVLSMGRVPEDSLAPALIERGLRVEEAGDCRTPRSIEEAILEGTLAVATLSRRVEAVAV